jgi:hypothetical protein
MRNRLGAGSGPDPGSGGLLCEDRRMRRLVAATVVTLSGLLLLAAPAGATKANSEGGSGAFNPIGPILVMLGIGALIFGGAYFLDKRKD